ncbi:MAG: GNAT family N-acetyltransferase, partial [Bosea sp. (in: a-proteobacteria)]
HRTRFSGMATSFEMGGEIAKTSPGEILLVDLIKRKCLSGIEVFDLGVGDARYKTTICDEKDDLVDSFFTVTVKGRAYAHFSRWKRALKGAIKQNPTALKIAQRASGLLSGRRPKASAED